MSIEDSEFGLDMGSGGMGYRVKSPKIVGVGKDPKPGLSDGPGKQRGIIRKINYIGTAMPREEAEKFAAEINEQKGIKGKLPWLRATVVEDKVR